MPVIVDQGEGQCCVRLAGEVGIASAAELKKILLGALTSGEELRLNLQAATELDITAWQLLWAAERKGKSVGKPIAIAGVVPREILAAVQDAGFDEFPFSLKTDGATHG